jgi:hypothetical protein
MHGHKTASFFFLVSTAASLAPTVHGQIKLTEITTVSLASTANPANPEYIGTNPSAVAWNGTELFVAGFNNDPAASQNVGIVKVSNVLTAPTFGATFGVVATPSFRGYSGLDVRGATLAAAYDNGAANPDGITAWDLAGTNRWRKNGRGGSGVGFDPGFPGGNPALGQGVAWTTFGSGRRALQDAATGADIWTAANGMVILVASETTNWRDVDFDDATGDIWLRTANNLIRGARNGDNSLSGLTVVFDANPNAPTINLQTCAVVGGGPGKFVVFNDRATGIGNQGFFQVVKAVRPDGTPDTLDFGPFAPNTGSAAYDFSWDPASGTLAILDFSNRNVHVFAVQSPPYYPFGQGCPGTGNVIPSLSASGSAQGGQSLTLDLTQGIGGGTGFVLFGARQGTTTLPNGCPILVDPVLSVFLGPQTLSGSAGAAGAGATSFALPIPAGKSGIRLTLQGAVIDFAVPGIPLALTNGVQLELP